MSDQLRRFLLDPSGASAIEYCFLGGLIALAIVAGLTTVGAKLNHFFVQIAAVN